MKKAVISIMIFFLSLITCGCASDITLTINRSSLSLSVGETLGLEARAVDKNNNILMINWSSSNDSIATVNNAGYVRAIAPGTCKIIVSSNQVKKSVSVIVSEILASSVSLNSSKRLVSINTTITLSATIYPSNTTNKALRWSSSNPSVASVTTQGGVTTLSVGTAIISVATTNNKIDSVKVVVSYDIGDVVKSEVEPNGTTSFADLIVYNGTTIYGVNGYKTDIDMFRVNLIAGETIEVIFTSNYRVDLPYYIVGLLNSNETAVAASTRNSNGMSFSYDVSISGAYYIVVLYSTSSPYSNGSSYSAFAYWG